MGRLQGRNQIVFASTLADLVQESVIGREINAAFLHQHGHAGAGDITCQQGENLRAGQRLLGRRAGGLRRSG